MTRSLEGLWEGIPVLARAALDPMKRGVREAVFLDKASLRPAAARLAEEGYHLEDVTGLDWTEGFEVLYHFCLEAPGSRIVLRVLASHESPEVPSISDIAPGALWHERECFDFFGVVFSGHPGLWPILLPDDLGMHPLVKSENSRMSLYACLEGYPELPAVQGEMYGFEPIPAKAEGGAHEPKANG